MLTARESEYEHYYVKDPTLLEKLPSGLQIVRTSVMRGFSKALRLRSCCRLNAILGLSAAPPASSIRLHRLRQESRPAPRGAAKRSAGRAWTASSWTTRAAFWRSVI